VTCWLVAARERAVLDIPSKSFNGRIQATKIVYGLTEDAYPAVLICPSLARELRRGVCQREAQTGRHKDAVSVSSDGQAHQEGRASRSDSSGVAATEASDAGRRRHSKTTVFESHRDYVITCVYLRSRCQRGWRPESEVMSAVPWNQQTVCCGNYANLGMFLLEGFADHVMVLRKLLSSAFQGCR
jgi:hypothetical protein